MISLFPIDAQQKYLQLYPTSSALSDSLLPSHITLLNIITEYIPVPAMDTPENPSATPIIALLSTDHSFSEYKWAIECLKIICSKCISPSAEELTEASLIFESVAPRPCRRLEEKTPLSGN